MGVKFKCKATGNVFEFQHPWDIADMKQHPQYEEVIEETTEDKKPEKKITKKEAKV